MVVKVIEQMETRKGDRKLGWGSCGEQDTHLELGTLEKGGGEQSMLIPGGSAFQAEGQPPPSKVGHA